MNLETTIKGQLFYETSLDQFEGINLPGLGKASAKELKKYGIVNASQILGLYILLGCDRDIFLNYLETMGICFYGNSVATRDEIKKSLCDTLDAKWNKIKNY
jgi:hypothetical protein